MIISNRQSKVTPDGRLVALLRRVAHAVFAQEGVPASAEVSLTFVDDATIRLYNRDYRQVDRPTDVLAFSQLEGRELRPLLEVPFPAPAGVPPVLLGDVLISLERAAEQAAERGHPLEVEASLLLVHGILHLLGYDHRRPAEARAMQRRERQIMKALGALPGDGGRGRGLP
ncbi:MAG: rRNA maturation RNase YbeY [Acetobacteraceae bacterium]|nr:rRNA maturation RNase YbeY [Acetobacteraceae bacterium]